MEPSLYDDHNYGSVMSGESSQAPPPPPPPAASAPSRKRPADNAPDASSLRELKKTFTLDLGSPGERARKATFLQTPDIVRCLQLASPELERILTQSGATVTSPTPTQYLCPKDVTAEQRQYAQGFIDALTHLHSLNGFVPPPTNNLLSPIFGQKALAESAAKDAAAAASSSDRARVTELDALSAASAAATATVAPTVVLVQSPTRATATAPIASVIMQSIDQISGHGLGLYHHQQATREQALSAVMSHMNVKRDGGGLVPCGVDYTTLVQAQPVSHAAAHLPPPAQYLDVTTSHAVRRAQAARGAVKQEDVHLVPNVAVTSSAPYAPQLAPPSCAPTPVNLEDQERVKLYRKRERNRLAAEKCRNRKLARINDLEGLKKAEEEKVAAKDALIEQEERDLLRLRGVAAEHKACGCEVTVKLVRSVPPMQK